MSSVAQCTYDSLVKAAQDNNPLVVNKDWLVVKITGLNPKDYYVTPFLFWAPSERPLVVQLLDPSETDKILKQWELEIGKSSRGMGANDWVRKRYKLNGERQNGTAYFRIGWPRSHPKQPTDIDFTICAGPLDSKKLRRQRAIDAGNCPECGTQGQWVRLALCCLNPDCETRAFG